MGDVYEMLTYLLVIIISCFVMGITLKRKAKKRLNESNSSSEKGGDN